MRGQHDGPLWLWGLRAGCLLACEVALRCVEPPHLLFWQPPTAGRTLLQQFLRLRLASGLSEGRSATAKDDVKAELAAGRAVEIAGYVLSPALAAGLDRARLTPPARPCQAAWIETSTREQPTLLPATSTALAAWRDAGHRVVAEVVGGPAFWQTQEIEDAPALVDATVRLMQSVQAIEVVA
jgi:exosortase A-associated hydrolase 2